MTIFKSARYNALARDRGWHPAMARPRFIPRVAPGCTSPLEGGEGSGGQRREQQGRTAR